jgi:hypothetical protein
LGCLATDDYSLLLYYRKLGFFGTQKMIFTGWTGRVTSTFIGTAMAGSGLLSHYIFLHPLLLLAGTWLALYFLLACIRRRLLTGFLSRATLALIATGLLLETIYVQAKTGEGYYWFSSAVSYQPAFILLLILSGCLLLRWRAGLTRRRWLDTVIVILILLIIGTNEVSAIQLMCFWAGLVFLAWYYSRSVPGILLVYLGLTVIPAAIIHFSSGILSGRAILMNPHTGLPAVLSIILLRSVSVFYYIGKNPLFWVSGLAAFGAGMRLARQPLAGLSLFKSRRLIVPGVLVLLGMVIVPLAAVLSVSHGSLPVRALNGLTQVTAIGFLALFFLAGAAYPVKDAGPMPALSPALLSFMLAVSLLANDKFVEAWESCLSGYFYHAVARDREIQMREAERNHLRTVRLEPFDQTLQAEIHKTFPHGVFTSLRTILVEKPALLPYDKEMGKLYPSYGLYYGVDTVLVGE